jgi:hypothetical protein
MWTDLACGTALFQTAFYEVNASEERRMTPPAHTQPSYQEQVYLIESRSRRPRSRWGRKTCGKLGQRRRNAGTRCPVPKVACHPYLAIVDNNDVRERLLVYRVRGTAGSKRLICEVPLFSAGASAAEDAPIGVGDTIVVENTYGYDYTDYRGSRLRQLPGGLTRVDVRPDGSGCATVWTNPIRGSGLAKLSIHDGYILLCQAE